MLEKEAAWAQEKADIQLMTDSKIESLHVIWHTERTAFLASLDKEREERAKEVAKEKEERVKEVAKEKEERVKEVAREKAELERLRKDNTAVLANMATKLAKAKEATTAALEKSLETSLNCEHALTNLIRQLAIPSESSKDK